MPLPEHNLLFGFEPKLTEEQREYVDSIFDNQMTIVNAKSGTGKTTLAVACAKIIGQPLVYVFSPVQEKAMGFRPGKQAEKEREYYQPLIDALLKINEVPARVLYDEDNPDALKAGHVWVYPKSHIFARGTNIEECTVIIDEAQNFTRGELKKLLTRIHDSAKVIMIGHVGQIDLPDPKKSGFAPYIEHFADEPYCKTVELSVNFRGKLAQHADELEW
jgi:phosphate starvation-inducible protein PhoH and related proteins